jgi:uracil-DNA glycosylase
MHPIQKNIYDSIVLERLINDSSIEVIKKNDDILRSQKLFDETYYSNDFPKIVLCGINPGKDGAGVTGVPFVDERTLDERLSDNNIKTNKTEPSAQFFNKIVDHFGAETFYKYFYVTNISWFGFTKNGNNFNYYKLSDSAQEYISKAFMCEMTLINPTTIVPLGEQVEKSLTRVFSDSMIKVENRLMHPRGCVSGTKRKAQCLNDYINLLESYME